VEEINNTQAAINAGIAMAKPFEINGRPAVMLPEGGSLKLLPELMETPERIKKTVNLRTIEAFIEYHNRYSNADSTIFANIDEGRFQSVLDYHTAPDFADNCDHIAVYTCPETREWQEWKAKSEEWMSQESFAIFLQDHHLQIFKPTPDEFKPEELDVVLDKLPDSTRMIEIAKTLQVTSESKAISGQNLHNGAMKISYTDEVDGRAGPNSDIEIPTYFLLGIQLFKGGKHYMVLCRLKYRKDGPSIRLRYELVRPYKAHERAVLDVITRLKGETKVLDAEGKPTEECLPGIDRGHIYEIVG
jgi:uncharacterized protein YfdQ (DUF2303 family)